MTYLMTKDLSGDLHILFIMHFCYFSHSTSVLCFFNGCVLFYDVNGALLILTSQN